MRAQEAKPVAGNTQVVDAEEHHCRPSDAPLVGVPTIDAEHRELMEQYRALIGSWDLGRDVTVFALFFRRFVSRVCDHFAREERMMLECGYDKLVRHKREHERLVRDAEDFLRSAITSPQKPDCLAVARYVKQWLVRHIRTHDREFAEFLNEDASSKKVVG